MEATTRASPCQHQVTLRGGGELRGEPSPTTMKRDKARDRERRRRRLLSRSMVYVNQVASASGVEGRPQQQFEQAGDGGGPICHHQAAAAAAAAAVPISTRRRRMSDFSDQTLAKLNDLKLDEAAPSNTGAGPQAGRGRARQQQMELAEAQQEQPLVAAPPAHESRCEPTLGLFGQQQPHSTSHFGELAHAQVQAGAAGAFASQAQHQQPAGSFPIIHYLGQPAQFGYHEPPQPAPPGPHFHDQQQQHHHHSHHSAYYPLLGPAQQTVDLVYSQAANYADLDETTRQRHQQRALELKCERATLPDSVLRLNQLAERSHQRLASSSASSHELHQSSYANQPACRQQQQQQQQQYYANNEFNQLTELDAAANNSPRAISDKLLDQSAGYEQQHYQQQQQHQHQLMSNSMVSVGSGMGPRSMYDDERLLSASQQSRASAHSALGQFGAHSAGATRELPSAAEAEPDAEAEGDELKVCEWLGCSSTFLDMAEFVRHLEEAHVNQEPREKNRYFCLWSNCKRNSQEFNARYKLLIHMRVHSGEKPYACKSANCNKSFSRLENLKIHVRSHTGDKPYKCTHGCSKSFTNSSDRIKHHKTHKDPKPYNCSIDGCTKRYTDPSSLRKHLRAHKRLGRELNHSAGQMLYSSGGRLRNSSALPPSCELNSSGYQNSSSYQNYSSPSSGLQQPEVQYQISEPSYEASQAPAAAAAGSGGYQLAADYDPTQDFEQTYFSQSHNSSYSASHQAAEQQFSRSFCAPSQGQGADFGHHQQAQMQQQQHFDAPAAQASGGSRRLELSVQHQALSRSWCAGAGPTQPNRQPALLAAQARQIPRNSSDNLLRPQQQQQRQHQQSHWTSSQQPWPSGGGGGQTFNSAANNNNRQLQGDASWGQNQFVSNELQQQQREQSSWRGRQQGQLMRSTSSGDTFAQRPHWLAGEPDDASARWQPAAK